MVLWILCIFFLYFILSYILFHPLQTSSTWVEKIIASYDISTLLPTNSSKTNLKEGYADPRMNYPRPTSENNPVPGEENHIERSINTLNAEVEKLHGKLDNFDKRITDLVGKTNDAMDRAQRAQDAAYAADDKITKLTKAMAPA